MSLLRFGKISKYSYQSSNVDTYSLQWTFTLDVFFPLHFPSKEQQYPTHVILVQENSRGTSLMVQWLRLHLPMLGVRVLSLTGDLRSHMDWAQKNKIQNRGNIVNKFNKDYKYGPHQKKKKWKQQRIWFLYTHSCQAVSSFQCFSFFFIHSSVARCLTWMQERHIWTMHLKLSVMSDLTIVFCFCLESSCLRSPPPLP